jgi:hypothetical protein
MGKKSSVHDRPYQKLLPPAFCVIRLLADPASRAAAVLTQIQNAKTSIETQDCYVHLNKY